MIRSPFCPFRAVTSDSTWLRTSRSSSVRPFIIAFSSWLIVLIWATPPPLSRNDSAPRTSSTSGLRPVWSSGMLSPSESWPDASAAATTRSPPAGSTNAMYFSPSRLVWRTSAITLPGSSTSLRIRIVTLACQPTRSTSSTCPTGTSSTITGVRGTTLSTSVKSAVTS